MLNHIYRVIFNHATGCYIVVSEIAKSGSKGGKSATVGSTPAITSAKLGNVLRHLTISSAIATVFGLTAMSSQAFVCTGTDPNLSNTTGGSTAVGAYAMACGIDNSATNYGSSAVGWLNRASDNNSSAIGYYNRASGTSSSALGYLNEASGTSSSAIGGQNEASGSYSSASGFFNKTYGTSSSAVGNRNTVSRAYSSAIGVSSQTSANGATALGSGGTSALAAIEGATVQATFTAATTPIETDNQGRRFKDDGSGGKIYEFALTDYETLGIGATASGIRALALGTDARANKRDSIALGSKSVTTVGAGVAGFDANGDTSPTWQSTLSAVSIGDTSDADPNNWETRQITGVAAGTADTDVVNVAQLKQVKTNYVSINSTDTTAGSNYNNDGATGVDAIAIGVRNTSSNNFSSAIGYKNITSNVSSTAVGYVNTASGIASSAIGNKNEAVGDRSLALGHSNIASVASSLAVGQSNRASGITSSAVGFNNKALGVSSSAIGHNNTASGTSSSAMGSSNNTLGAYSTAVGRSNSAIGERSLALGAYNKALADNSLAVGSHNEASEYSSALGTYNKALGFDSTAMGYANQATGAHSTAMGHGNIASGAYGSAIGVGNETSANGATALGSGNPVALADVEGAIVQSAFTAAGTPIETDYAGRRFKGDGSGGKIYEFALTDYEALGIGATASGTRALALGTDALADKRDSIALGSKSVTTVGAGVAGFGANGDTSPTWQSTLSAVSVGDTSDANPNNWETRQITGVAAGTADTDVVNVAQLKQNANLSVNYDTPARSSIFLGNTGTPVSITNVAPAFNGLDAVNLNQLKGVANILGGGSGFDSSGSFTPPTYTINGNDFNDVNSAFEAVDSRLTTLAGQTGATGDSAYQVAVNNGFTGTEAQWLTSLKGEQGIQGLKGDKGETGAQGIQGLKGDKGETGAQGIQGLKGDKGDTGAQGVQGLNGQDGINGIDGKDGADGPKGDKGDTGAQGPVGPQGPAGIDGEDGKDGLNGMDGVGSGVSEEILAQIESKIEENEDHFVSINISGNEGAINYDNKGATVKGAIAIGANTQSTGKDSIAMGTGSTVTGKSSISIGTNNTVSGDLSGAIGDPSIVGGNSSYSVGNNNIIGDTSDNVSVIGSNTTVGATGASIVESSPVFTGVTDASNAVAIGESVNVQAANAVSIGANSSATHSNAVALGANSQSTADNTVSVGSANNQRRITNVAAGINSNDAVNVSQLNQNRAEAFGYTDRRINDLEGETHSAVAGALAFGALRYPNTPGKVSVGLGGGTWEGETGYAFGVGYTTSDGQFSISSAFGGSGSQNGGNVGVSYTFD